MDDYIAKQILDELTQVRKLLTILSQASSRVSMKI
jgi:hypothetical protein